MRIRPDVELANLSDVGCVRTVNEDYFLYMEPPEDDEFARRGRLLMVADGMGGHKGGEVASSLATDIVREDFLRAESNDPRSILIDSFQRAHHAILEVSGNHRELQGMGTTCCAAILKDGNLTYGHVGDSRLYLIRGAHAQRLTEDHTLVNALLQRGVLTPEEARTHDQRNVLTAALGSEALTIAGDFAEVLLHAGDMLLMCSDGLHGVVSDEEMGSLASENSPSETCRRLIALAKQRGGPDNITVQLLQVRDTPHDQHEG